MTLPVVILSVLSGSGNFVAGQFKLVEKYLILGIGALSIFVSIISAVSQYLKLGELKTEHRIAALSWGKFYSSIRFQLQLRRTDRSDPKDFLSGVCSEYDRLYEISPVLLSRFIDKMTKKLQGLVTDRFKQPYYLNGYSHMQTFGAEEQFDDNSVEDEKVHDD